MSRLGLVTFVAREYDEAIGFFVGKLDFELVEETNMGDGKRWVVVAPTSGLNSGASLLIARAVCGLVAEEPCTIGKAIARAASRSIQLGRKPSRRRSRRSV